MGEKVLYHIEHYFDNAWHAVKVRLLESHNFARWVEWHYELDVAIKYGEHEQANAKVHAPYRKAEFRVTDHLGNVHWAGAQ